MASDPMGKARNHLFKNKGKDAEVRKEFPITTDKIRHRDVVDE